MSSLSVDSAKNLAIGAVVVFLVMALASAWVVKHAVAKLITVVLMAGLALGAWTQRTNLERCVDSASQAVQVGADVTCTFFGTDVQLPTP
ncbi:MAG: hypothetical protein KGR47_13275 [Acidobacteria bacterium]|nr:hypothetical protein [Acidobacteriota bacterium]